MSNPPINFVAIPVDQIEQIRAVKIHYIDLKVTKFCPKVPVITHRQKLIKTKLFGRKVYETVDVIEDLEPGKPVLEIKFQYDGNSYYASDQKIREDGKFYKLVDGKISDDYKPSYISYIPDTWKSNLDREIESALPKVPWKLVGDVDTKLRVRVNPYMTVTLKNGSVITRNYKTNSELMKDIERLSNLNLVTIR